jgi:toxin CcdB
VAQFHVYRLAEGELVLDVQTDLLSGIESRLVVPLMRPDEAPIAHRRLNPRVIVGDQTFVMVTQFLVAIHARELRDPIADLDSRYDDIRAALDMIFLGF